MNSGDIILISFLTSRMNIDYSAARSNLSKSDGRHSISRHSGERRKGDTKLFLDPQPSVFSDQQDWHLAESWWPNAI